MVFEYPDPGECESLPCSDRFRSQDGEDSMASAKLSIRSVGDQWRSLPVCYSAAMSSHSAVSTAFRSLPSRRQRRLGGPVKGTLTKCG